MPTSKRICSNAPLRILLMSSRLPINLCPSIRLPTVPLVHDPQTMTCPALMEPSSSIAVTV